MTPTSHSVAVLGASGYIGEELVRILARHPGVQLRCVNSRQHAGKRLDQVFPGMRGLLPSVEFTSSTGPEIAKSGIDFAFLSMPHGLAAEYAVPLVEAGIRVIDLSADFRLKDAAVYKEFYAEEHPAPELLRQSVYGLPETRRDAIRSAKLLAAPGCYPTSILVPLLPLLRARLIEPNEILVSSMSGVSGAGRKAEIDYLFAECNESVRPYGIPKHRHLSEIEQELSIAAEQTIRINFTPHLIPVNRGILTTIYTRPATGVSAEEIGDCWRSAYAEEPFVRLLEGSSLPDIKHVARTNFVDLAFRHDPRTGRLILLSAEDNLVKGAAGQAVQCFNLMSGWPETTALL